jgi:hypothetical protein
MLEASVWKSQWKECIALCCRKYRTNFHNYGLDSRHLVLYLSSNKAGPSQRSEITFIEPSLIWDKAMP